MARKLFISWLFSKDKKPLYEDKASRLVLEGDGSTFTKPDGQPAHLQHTPNGWKDVLVKYARNLKYIGLLRDMTVQMRFVADGAKVLRNRMLLFGYEYQCYFALDKLDQYSFPYKYKPWYLCELDFTTFSSSRTEVSINAMEGGLVKLLKAREGITYEIPISSDAQAKNVLLDGIPFTNKISYNIYSNQDIYGDFYYMGAGIVGNEGSTQGIISQDSQYNGNVPPGTNWFHRHIDKTLNVRIKGSYGINVHVTGRVSQYIKKSSPFQDIPTSTTDYTLYNAVHNAGDNFQVSFDVTIPMAPSEFLHLRAFPNTVPSASNWYTITGGSFDITYEVTFNESHCKGLLPYRFCENLVSKMTDGKYGVQSTFLQSLDDIILTCGPSIRDFFAANTVAKSSLLDFLQSFKKYGIGLGIKKDLVNGDKIVIEQLPYFFKTSKIIDLGEISNLSYEPAKDLLFNTIETGNKNQEYDAINGRDEFNVTQLWKMPNERTVAKLDLVSVYRDDMYGVELLRVNLYKKDTTDNKGDNEVFRLNINPTEQTGNVTYYSGSFETIVSGSIYFIKIPVSLSQIPNGNQLIISGATANNGTFTVLNTSYIVAGYTIITVAEPVTAGTFGGYISLPNFKYYELNRPAYSIITGLLHPAESFNVELSPKTSLLPEHNGRYIRSCTFQQDINKITFQTGDKNSDLSRTLGGVTITEKEDVEIGNLGDRLFQPFYFKFRTKVPFNYLELIEAEPYGLINFTYRGIEYNGFLWDGGIKPAVNDVQEWTLLCGPNVDLSKLIDNA